MRKPLAVLALAAALAGPPTFLDPLWSLLTSVWGASSSDEGCIMDPNGRCLPSPRADEGLGMDPNG